MLKAKTYLGLTAVLVSAALGPQLTQRARASETPETLLLLRPSQPEALSTSIGYPWHGHLERGMLLAESDLIRHVDEYTEHDRFYGTWQLVQLVTRAAAHVSRVFPGSRLSVGELSGPKGGRIAGHHSHRNGRDIDIGFYLNDDDGAPAFAPSFVPMRKSGNSHFAGKPYHFDDARNWALLAALLSDDDARVQFVFVAHTMQKRLLAQAQREGASQELVTRARAVMLEPTEGNRHQSHFHVRIYCPAEDRPGCVDRPPFFPWYPGPPPGGQYATISRGIALSP